MKRMVGLGIGLGLIAAVAVAAGSKRLIFFAADREHAVYDLAARAPADILNYRGYDGAPYTESFYYQFDGRDGSDFFCHVMMVDLGFGLKRFGVDYKLRYPDGKTVFFGTQYEVEQTEQATDRFEWKVGPNRISGDASGHRLEINDGPVKVDVSLKTKVPPYLVQDGKMCLGDDCAKHGMIVYFPLFEASGSVAEGGKKLEIAGWGYGNRVNQNFMLTEMSKFHTALRWQQDGLGFDVHDYETPPELGSEWLPILMVYQDGRMIHVSQRYQKENLEYYEEPRSKKRIPTSYRVTSEGDGVKVTIEFTGVKIGDYNDPLISLGPIEKYMVGLVADSPLDLRFDGHVKLTLETAEGVVVKEGPGHGLALVSQ